VAGPPAFQRLREGSTGGGERERERASERAEGAPCKVAQRSARAQTVQRVAAAAHQARDVVHVHASGVVDRKQGVV